MNGNKNKVNGAEAGNVKQFKDSFAKEIRPQLYAFLNNVASWTVKKTNPGTKDLSFLVGRWAITMDGRGSCKVVFVELTVVDNLALYFLRGDASEQKMAPGDYSRMITPEFAEGLKVRSKPLGFGYDISRWFGASADTRGLHFEHTNTGIKVGLMPAHEFDQMITLMEGEHASYVLFDANDKPIPR
jgi:hypothetical protein